MDRKASCLICSESIAILKEYNIARHKEKYKKLVGALRREVVLSRKGLSRSRKSSGDDPIIVSVHCCKLSCRSVLGYRKRNFFPTGNS
jgi:hypothetical protein